MKTEIQNKAVILHACALAYEERCSPDSGVAAIAVALEHIESMEEADIRDWIDFLDHGHEVVYDADFGDFAFTVDENWEK